MSTRIGKQLGLEVSMNNYDDSSKDTNGELDLYNVEVFFKPSIVDKNGLEYLLDVSMHRAKDTNEFRTEIRVYTPSVSSEISYNRSTGAENTLPYIDVVANATRISKQFDLSCKLGNSLVNNGKITPKAAQELKKALDMAVSKFNKLLANGDLKKK